MRPPTVHHPTGRPNFCTVDLGHVAFWFSYETCVAFRGPGGLRVCENMWGPTTGKHLNYVEPRKECRLPRDEFLRQLSDLMTTQNIQFELGRSALAKSAKRAYIAGTN